MIKFISFATILLTAGLFLTACRIDSPDSTSRNVQINVAGNYSVTITPPNSGARITSLNVIQDGSSLQAVDNNGLIFRGNIGSVTAQTSASFTLKGQTTAGAEGVISGTFNVSGNSSRMQGTWAEPSLFGTVSGSATVEQSDQSALTVTPSGPVTVGVGSKTNFSASGGTGTFSWSISDTTLGSLNQNSGASVEYTATTLSGAQTLTVTSGGSSKKVEITQ
jgi:hypothetical protein